MCYSNSLTISAQQLEKTYGRKLIESDDSTPRYYQSGFTFPEWPCVTQEEELINMRWGLIPAWYRGTEPSEIASKTLNARIETLEVKASFKHLVGSKRCIIPSSGFFEYQMQDSYKKLFFIYPKDHTLFHMGGIYDEWTDLVTGKTRKTFSIITTEANLLMADIHNSARRMPLIFTSSQVEPYLSGEISLSNFTPPPSELMQAHPVDKRILQREKTNVPEIQARFVNNIGIQGSLF
jgi:putative SOS response-associated peptidase YedK